MPEKDALPIKEVSSFSRCKPVVANLSEKKIPTRNTENQQSRTFSSQSKSKDDTLCVPSTSRSASSQRFRQSADKTAQLTNPSKKPEEKRDYLEVIRENFSKEIEEYFDSSSDEETTVPGACYCSKSNGTIFWAYT